MAYRSLVEVLAGVKHLPRYAAFLTSSSPSFRHSSEADQRWHGLARFLEQSGLDENAELIGRLAHRAERRERRRHYIAELRLGSVDIRGEEGSSLDGRNLIQGWKTEASLDPHDVER
jgi:hypothetical protein